MSFIKDIVLSIEPPKSIWTPTIVKDYHGNEMIQFNTTEWHPQCPSEDTIMKLIYSKVSPNFDGQTQKFKINVDNVYYRVRNYMEETIRSVYEENSTKLHPFKTKVGKWLTESQFLKSDATEDVITKVYKYIIENRRDKKHMENAFKIIEVLHTKYNDVYPSPKSRQRRRRRW